MHWLAIIFLEIKAFYDIARNLSDIIDGKYNNIISKVLSTLLVVYAWYYVLSYVFSGVQ